MTDKDRDLTPQGNAPSWVDEVLASSSPAAPRPVEGRHGGVTPGSVGRPASGWEDWPPSTSGQGTPGHGASGHGDPARDLRLPEDPPRPAPPRFDAPRFDAPRPAASSPGASRFDADDWVARATGGQVRDPRVGGAPQRTTSAAAPQTDAWGEPLRSGLVPVSPVSPAMLPLHEDIGQKKLVAGLLGIFLGSLGVHKFYLGQNGAGLLMLAVNLGVWVLAVVLSLLTLGFGAVVLFPLAGFVSSVLGVIGLIEGIIYLTKSDADFQRDYLYGKKAWL